MQMISKSSGHGGKRRGAGRRGYRRKVEDCPARLEIRQIHAGATLLMDWPAGPRFTIEARPNAVSIVGAVGRVWLRQRVPIVKTACHFGGSRSWFACPACGAPVAHLYFRADRFACRKCSRLVYSSSYRSRHS